MGILERFLPHMFSSVPVDLQWWCHGAVRIRMIVMEVHSCRQSLAFSDVSGVTDPPPISKSISNQISNSISNSKSLLMADFSHGSNPPTKLKPISNLMVCLSHGSFPPPNLKSMSNSMAGLSHGF